MIASPLLCIGLLVLQACAISLPSKKDSEAGSTRILPSSASYSTALAALQLEGLSSYALGVSYNSIAHNSGSKCTRKTLRVRRNWRTFSSREKKAYIKSIRCLQSKPARTPANVAAGAKSRYDDFVATHINQTLVIHYTGTFLAWHRYYVHIFEEALRNECGYTGDFPYWNWGDDAHNMAKSPIFDGSSTSLSGNGAYIANQEDIALTLQGYDPIYIPAGTGGGCVTSGPFKDYQVNLGPAALSVPGGNTTSAANPLAYNPRCLKRSLTTSLLRDYANYTSIVQLILENQDIWDFEMNMQGVPGSGLMGVHGAGHYSMGGDPGRDVFVSPGDPAFWHHHGMIDRVWTIWQNLDLAKRKDAISGTGTFLNSPPSPNTTLDTVFDLGYAGGGSVAMRDLMSTTAGPFCYVYV